MRAVPWIVALLAAVVVPAAVAQDTPAASPPPPAPSPSPEASPSPTPPPAPRPPFVAGYKNGFTLQSETGDFVLKLTGYLQADGRFALADLSGGWHMPCSGLSRGHGCRTNCLPRGATGFEKGGKRSSSSPSSPSASS